MCPGSAFLLPALKGEDPDSTPSCLGRSEKSSAWVRTDCLLYLYLCETAIPEAPSNPVDCSGAAPSHTTSSWTKGPSFPSPKHSSQPHWPWEGWWERLGLALHSHEAARLQAAPWPLAQLLQLRKINGDLWTQGIFRILEHLFQQLLAVWRLFCQPTERGSHVFYSTTKKATGIPSRLGGNVPTRKTGPTLKCRRACEGQVKHPPYLFYWLGSVWGDRVSGAVKVRV